MVARNFNLDLSDGGYGGNGVVFESIKPFSKRHHLLPFRLPLIQVCLVHVCGKAGIHMPLAPFERANFSRGAAKLKKVEASSDFEIGQEVW